MARFPRNRTDLAALLAKMVSGFANNTTIYAAPPVSPAELLARQQTANDKTTARVALEIALAHAVDDEGTAFTFLEDGMRSDLTYAEGVALGDAGKLHLIGWDTAAAPAAAQAPGQPRALEVARRGDDWVFLDWKEPVGGGKVLFYKVKVRVDGGAWQDGPTVIASEATIHGIARGHAYEWSVVAINKTGESVASNVVSGTF